MKQKKSILLIISGGIAAYKSLELIRLMKKANMNVRCILTEGGAQFVTPLSVAALTEEKVYGDLWSLKDETEMGHIRLSREADLIVVAPASANIIAKMAWGLADDLATTTLLAANKPILIAPAMNPMMWNNPATQTNIKTLQQGGILMIGPNPGNMACGETGTGRMAEPEEIFASIKKSLMQKKSGASLSQKKSNAAYLKSTIDSEKPLRGKTALVTAGPTYEPIDPVRFIGNHSSGKQGQAIADALTAAGVKVTLVMGPMTAADMLRACERALPVDIAVCAAAVADWTPIKPAKNKIKKGSGAPVIALKENPDILKTISNHKKRPKLVIGFAAETDDLVKNAKAKLKKKGCDWILANDVSKNVFGADDNTIHFITTTSTEKWPRQPKTEIARHLVSKIAENF